MPKKNGIFCIEGMWESNLKKPSSVRPILELLKNRNEANFIYRDCVTKEELKCYLKKWLLYRDYPILYIATHGKEETIYLGKDNVALDTLSEWLEDKCHNRIIILGSCSVLAIHKSKLKKFLKRTGALGICGYKADVDWMISTAFELLMLYTLQGKNNISGYNINALRNEIIGWSKNKDFKNLFFRMETQKTITNIKPWDKCSDLTKKEIKRVCRKQCDYYRECPKRRKAMKQ